MEAFLEIVGDEAAIVLAGLLTGLLFGAGANHAQFCLRSASVELWRGKPGGRFAVWLLVFGVALGSSQWLIATDRLPVDDLRQLTGTGSLLGAAIGGLLFGVGMILARGCASRLLVLSATGNLRALLTGLVLTVVAQASLTGVLAPLRQGLSGFGLISGAERDLSRLLPESGPMLLAIACLVLAVALAIRTALRPGQALAAVATGGAVALGWYLTSMLADWSFEPVTIQSISLTGPSANTLMALIYRSDWPADFGFGLVPGIFLGSLLTTLAKREFRLQAFDADSGMLRYLAGACLMGFGGMLAGGCAVGAGITGGSVLAATSWLALFSMWLGSGIADRLLERAGASAAQPGAHTAASA